MVTLVCVGLRGGQGAKQVREWNNGEEKNKRNGGRKNK